MNRLLVSVASICILISTNAFATGKYESWCGIDVKKENIFFAYETPGYGNFIKAIMEDDGATVLTCYHNFAYVDAVVGIYPNGQTRAVVIRTRN